jgi:hypothetical protein
MSGGFKIGSRGVGQKRVTSGASGVAHATSGLPMRFALLTATAMFVLPAIGFAQSTAQPATPQTTTSAPSATQVPSTNGRGAREMSPEARARFEAFRAACGADLKVHCGDIQRDTDEGRAAMRQCVETHKAKFSVTCKTAIAERDAAREARKQNQAAPAAEKPKT